MGKPIVADLEITLDVAVTMSMTEEASLEGDVRITDAKSMKEEAVRTLKTESMLVEDELKAMEVEPILAMDSIMVGSMTGPLRCVPI
jgi:hypothetical protein